MTLAELKNILESAGNDAFKNKVAYRAFPVNAAPDLPFICFQCTQTDNFMADSVVCKVVQEMDVELYTDEKEPETEAALEAALTSAGLTWDKFEDYIESENCFMITYEVNILQ